MKPVYQSCMEKGIQHVATHATEYAISGGPSSPSSRSAGSRQLNGKVKHSWEYASSGSSNDDHQLGRWWWPFSGGAAAAAANRHNEVADSGRFGWLFSPSSAAAMPPAPNHHRHLSNGSNNSRFSVFFDSLRGSTSSNVKRSTDTDNNNSRTGGRVIKGPSSTGVGSRAASGDGPATKFSGRRRTKTKAWTIHVSTRT